MTRRMQRQRSHTSPAGSCARASASHWLAKSLSSSSGSGSKLTGCMQGVGAAVETARANAIHHLRLQGANDELGVVALPVDDLHAQSLDHSPQPTPGTPPLKRHVTAAALPAPAPHLAHVYQLVLDAKQLSLEIVNLQEHYTDAVSRQYVEGDLKAQLVCHALQCALYTKPTPPDRANATSLQVSTRLHVHGDMSCHAHIIATRTCSSSCRCILLISASPPLPPPAAAGTRLLPHEACTKTCDSSPVWGSRTCNKRGLGFQYITRGR